MAKIDRDRASRELQFRAFEARAQAYFSALARYSINMDAVHREDTFESGRVAAELNARADLLDRELEGQWLK